jgi:serine/threonine-protein phosphatase PGAM5
MSRRAPASFPLPVRFLPAVLALVFGADGTASATAQPTPPVAGTRTLVLVRHGMYDLDDPADDDTGKGLTEVGREQARLTARRLAAWPARIDALYASAMRRARETAAIVADSLRIEPVIVRDLRECTPPSDRADVNAELPPGEADACRARLDEAFARYFRRSPGADSTEVLICHGNVIRSLVCRALRIDPERWLAMTIANCSLTVIEVRADGSMRLVSFSDVGHLPVALQTYPRARPGPNSMK